MCQNGYKDAFLFLKENGEQPYTLLEDDIWRNCEDLILFIRTPEAHIAAVRADPNRRMGEYSNT